MNTFWIIAIIAVMIFSLSFQGRIDPSKAREMKKAGALIIDVRTPQEYSADGGVRGAVNIPLQLIQDGTASLPGDMNTAILVYCRSGSRSSAARQLLIKMGYTSVENLGSLGSARDIMEKAAAE